MRSRLLTLLWVLGILFPLAFLARLWPPLGQVFERIFAPAWMHVLMHAALYAVLGALLSARRRLLPALALGLGVAVLHETLQYLAASGKPGWSAVAFDLGVDLAGLLAGMACARAWRRRRPVSSG